MTCLRTNLRYALLLAICCLALTLQSCIHNDIPFPKISQDITALAAADEVRSADISSTDYSATVYLTEQTDIRNVRFTTFEYTPGAEVSQNLLDGTYDLSEPITVTLSKYQTYDWTIAAVQQIERYFTVEGQVGQEIIDADAHTVTVTLPESADLSSLVVTSIKLGAADVSSMSPDLQKGQTLNLSKPIQVAVSAFGREEIWTLSAVRSAHVVDITDAAAWSMVIWVSAAAPENAANGFRFRRADASQWTQVPDKDITFNGGSFTACIPHLEPLTDYVVQAFSGSEVSSEVHLHTQATEILPGGSFDNWWKDGAVWNPWAQDGQKFWDTGNPGAATLGQSNVVPSDHTPDGQGKSACLQTKFVGIGPLGKLAAGSIYTGSFAKVDGTNGVLDFGRPWTLRPTKLKGYYQYKSCPIDYASSEYKELIGRPDSLCIYIALADWTAPYVIRTNPKNRHLFDKDAPSIIAYGEIVTSESTDGYIPFEIRLDYRDPFRTPTYIQITCAASKYGDFFTGGTGTVLYVDQLSLEYDY